VSGNRSGLIALADGVRAYFVAQGIAAKVGTVGRHQRAEQINQGPGGASRVLFFEPDSGDLGEYVRGHQVSTNPPVLWQWDRPVILSVWGVDAAHLADEEKQSQAAESLSELTWQGIRRAVDPVTGQAIGFASIPGPVKVTKITSNVDGYFGCEIQAQFKLRCWVADVAQDTTIPQFLVTRDLAT